MNCWKCGKELGTGDIANDDKTCISLCTACFGRPKIAALGELWSPTLYLQWRNNETLSPLRRDKVLQQLWRNELGDQEWRDVPVEV